MAVDSDRHEARASDRRGGGTGPHLEVGYTHTPASGAVAALGGNSATQRCQGIGWGKPQPRKDDVKKWRAGFKGAYLSL
jgi:hypothetical protein